MDPSAIDELAETFMRARRAGERLDALPARLAPKNFKESCAVMDAVDKLVGEPIVGTKIAAKPGAEVVYAPLRAGRVFNSSARAAGADALPIYGMRDQLSSHPRSAGAGGGIFGSRGVRYAGRLRGVRAGRQPLPRSQIRDGEHAVPILRRLHRQRRHGVRCLARTGRNSTSATPACR
jgi:hypothetical protein